MYFPIAVQNLRLFTFTLGGSLRRLIIQNRRLEEGELRFTVNR